MSERERSRLASTVYECLRESVPMGVDAFRRGTFQVAKSMHVPRAYHSATRIDDRVLMVGGVTGDRRPTATAEAFDGDEQCFHALRPMGTPRSHHTATALPNGMLLVAGGTQSAGSMEACAHAELYDPLEGRWIPVCPMGSARARHAAVLLQDGCVLVSGGCAPGRLLSQAEIYDPFRDTWRPVAPMRGARSDHTLTLLGNGRVLVVGRSPVTTGSCETYDPKADKWRPTAHVLEERCCHSATLLPDGRVLVTGGIGARNASAGAAELFYPHWQAWGEADQHPPCDMHAAVSLLDGSVAVIGGLCRSSKDVFPFLRDECTIFDPTVARWSRGPTMARPRFAHSATIIPYVGVLVAGGIDSPEGAVPTAECELLVPSWEGFSRVT